MPNFQPEPAKPQGWGEPWEVDDLPNGGQWRVLAPLNVEVGAFESLMVIARSDSARMADRIVACVNACQGIANPDKLGELLEVCQMLVRNEGRVAFRDQCAWFDDVKAVLAAIGALPAGDAA